MNCGRLSFVIYTVIFLFSQTSFATQPAEAGSISGKVTDDRSAAVAAVMLTATTSDGRVAGVTHTDSAGAYSLPLPAREYTLRFTASGFKSVKVLGVVVVGGSVIEVDASLATGSPDEVVVVPWQAPAEGGTPSAAGPQPGGASVKNLPLASRNYTQAAGLASGVSSQVSNATAVGMNTEGVQVGSGSTSNYMVDGASVAAGAGAADSPGVANPDAIQENSVQSWSYAAGPERYSGANIAVTTKSGTDAFHGTLFEFVRNDIFNSNDFFMKRNGFPRPVLKQNQFGFTLGGPVLKKRLYFFVSYQGTRQRNGFAQSGFAPQVNLPPLPTTRSAAALGAMYCGKPGFFGGVAVDCLGANINPAASKLLNLKLPNGAFLIPGSSTGKVQTVPLSIPATFQEDQILFNSDFILTEKQKLQERFFWARDPQTASFTGGPNSLPGTPSTTVNGNIYGVVRLVSTLSSSLVNELRVSGQHDLLTDTPLVPFTNGDAGIASVTPAIGQLDIVNIAGLFNLGGGGMWDYNSVDQYQFADQVSWTRGRHAMRMGFEVDRRQWNTRLLGNARGSLSFYSFPDFLLGLPGCSPSQSPTACAASASLSYGGAVTNGTYYSNIYQSQGPEGPTADVTGPEGIPHAYRFADASGYFQDDIRLTSRLQVNPGLRWDYFGVLADSTGNLTNFWPSLAGAWSAPVAGGTYLGFVVPSNFSGSLPAGVTRNARGTPLPMGAPRAQFAPRLGFAWQALASGSLVVRGGYGMFYDRPDAATMEMQTNASAPYAVPVGGAGTANYQATLAQPFPSTVLGWGSARAADLIAGTTSNLSLSMLDENFTAPLTQKWNLEIQAQLPRRFTVVVGYAGAHSIHLQDTMRQINEPSLASPSGPVNGITVNTVANAALRVPYLGIAPAGLNDQQTQGAAKYNGLQATVTKTTHNGFHVQAAYKFSKTLSNLAAAPPQPGTPGTGSFDSMDSNDPLDARQMYGPLMMVAPQRLAVNYGWELPWKKTGLRGLALNGWGFSGLTIIQSGAPFTILDSRGGSIYGNAGASRAQLCPGKRLSDVTTSGGVQSRLNAYFNLASLADTSETLGSSACPFPTIGDGTGYGNTSVGFFLTPGQDNTDFSITKAVDVRDSKLELHVEFFNVFNHPQFSMPDGNVTDPTFGEITSTSVNPRLIQFALKYSF